MCELGCEESWAPKNWCFWTVVLEKTPENPLDCKEIKPFNLKENQLWILMGCTDAKAETPVFWSSDVNSWLTGKVPEAWKDWGQKEKRVSEDEMARWHYWCNEHKLGQTLGDGEGQRDLVCYSLWVRKQSDMTGPLNNNNNICIFQVVDISLGNLDSSLCFIRFSISHYVLCIYVN